MNRFNSPPVPETSPERLVQGQTIGYQDLNRTPPDHLIGMDIQELRRFMPQLDSTTPTLPSSDRKSIPNYSNPWNELKDFIENGSVPAATSPHHRGASEPVSEPHPAPIPRLGPPFTQPPFMVTPRHGSKSSGNPTQPPIPRISRAPLGRHDVRANAGRRLLPAPATPSPPAPLAQEHMKRRLAEREVEDLNRFLAAARVRCQTLERQFQDTNDHLRTTNLSLRQVEDENRTLKAFEEEYQKSAQSFIKMNAAKEIHIQWLEKEVEVYKTRSVDLYREKRQAEALVAEAVRQGFLPNNLPPH